MKPPSYSFRHAIGWNKSGKFQHLTSYVKFEFSTGADSLYMSLHIDDEQHDLRVNKIPMCCSPNPAIFHVGTSLEGDRNEAFDLYETYNVGRTLSLHERLGSYVRYLDKFERGKFFEH